MAAAEDSHVERVLSVCLATAHPGGAGRLRRDLRADLGADFDQVATLVTSVDPRDGRQRVDVYCADVALHHVGEMVARALDGLVASHHVASVPA